MEDCCTVFCCPGCAIIQLHKQIDPKTNILGLQKWEDTIYTFTYPLVFLKNKSGTFEKKLLSTSLISMSCVHQVLLPVSVITHRSHKQRKQPSVCILLDRCIALWPTNSIRETSSLFTPGQLWRHSMEQRRLSNVVSLYTPARAVHSTLESSSVWWSCWHGLGESQRRVSKSKSNATRGSTTVHWTQLTQPTIETRCVTSDRLQLLRSWVVPFFNVVRLSFSFSGNGDTRLNLHIMINCRGLCHQC